MAVVDGTLLSFQMKNQSEFCPSDQRTAMGARVKCIATYVREGECGKYLTLYSYFNVQSVLLLLK